MRVPAPAIIIFHVPVQVYIDAVRLSVCLGMEDDCLLVIGWLVCSDVGGEFDLRLRRLIEAW